MVLYGRAGRSSSNGINRPRFHGGLLSAVKLVFVLLLDSPGERKPETWVFVIIAAFVHMVGVKGSLAGLLSDRRVSLGLVSSLLIYCAVFFLLRWYFGISSYHCSFWMYVKNMDGALKPYLPFSIWHVGSGLMFLYVVSLIAGNRLYIGFILGYLLPLLVVSFFISNQGEHRIFYPVYPLLILSIAVHFAHTVQHWKSPGPAG